MEGLTGAGEGKQTGCEGSGFGCGSAVGHIKTKSYSIITRTCVKYVSVVHSIMHAHVC